MDCLEQLLKNIAFQRKDLKLELSEARTENDLEKVLKVTEELKELNRREMEIETTILKHINNIM